MRGYTTILYKSIPLSIQYNYYKGRLGTYEYPEEPPGLDIESISVFDSREDIYDLFNDEYLNEIFGLVINKMEDELLTQEED